MSELNESLEELQAIADRCETPEDVYREVSRLSQGEKMRMVFGTCSNEFVEEVKENAVAAIDLADALNLLNDKEARCYRRSQALGFLHAIAKTFELSSEQQSRRELQHMTEHSQYAVKVADTINDLAREMMVIIEGLITLDSEYAAILKGRQCEVHFTDNKGTYVPFSEEEASAREQRLQLEALDFDRWQAKERKRLELIYAGKIDPPELVEGVESRQLGLPLWV